MTRRALFLILGSILGTCTQPGCTRPYTAANSGPVPVGPVLCQVNIPEPQVPLDDPRTIVNQQSGSVISFMTQTHVTHGTIVLPELDPPVESAANFSPSLVFPRLEQPIPAAAPASFLGPALPDAPLLSGNLSEPQEAPLQATKLETPQTEPLVKALECALAHKPNKALDWLKSYDPATQDFFIRLLPIMARVTQKSLEQMNPEEMAVIQEQLEGFVDTLRPRAELLITKMCFCKPISIKGFGIYEPLADGHLFHAATKPGREAADGEGVDLYVELRNFSSEPRDLFHETRLASWVEIRDPKEDAKNGPLWKFRFDDKMDRRRARVHDFHLTYWFTVPYLPAGFYLLTIHVVDEADPGKPRRTSKSVPFQVTSLPLRNP